MSSISDSSNGSSGGGLLSRSQIGIDFGNLNQDIVSELSESGLKIDQSLSVKISLRSHSGTVINLQSQLFDLQQQRFVVGSQLVDLSVQLVLLLVALIGNGNLGTERTDLLVERVVLFVHVRKSLLGILEVDSQSRERSLGFTQLSGGGLSLLLASS